MCVCVDVLFFAVVSSGNNKKALAGALVKELLLWRVIVCEKIFSVVKKRGSQRQSCEFRVSFLKVFFPFFLWKKKTNKPQKKKKEKERKKKKKELSLDDDDDDDDDAFEIIFFENNNEKKRTKSFGREGARLCFWSKGRRGFFFLVLSKEETSERKSKRREEKKSSSFKIHHGRRARLL